MPPPPGLTELQDSGSMSTAGRPKRDEIAVVKLAADLWEQECHERGFLARVFTQTSLPYRNPGDDLPAWVRYNGNRSAGITLALQPGPPYLDPKTGQFVPIGYPYGTIPRLLLTWLSTEAVRTKERVIPLGDSLSDFMRQLGLIVSGGRFGNIRKLREQTQRLFQSRITVDYRESVGSGYGYQRDSFKQVTIADSYDLYAPTNPEQLVLVPSYVELSERFFQEVTENPVPVSLDALRQLRGSPMRLDIYAWLVHRMSYLSKSSNVPWDSLMIAVWQ